MATSRPASGFDLLAALADHHHASFGAERVDRVEQMQQHRPAGDRVQHLVRVGRMRVPFPAARMITAKRRWSTMGASNGMPPK